MAPIKFAICLPLCVFAFACQTTVKKDVAHPDTTVTVNGTRQDQPGGNARTLDEALGTDESVVRLEKIINTTLLYYSIKRELPQKLSDLVPLTDGDLQLNAPSDQPYVYHRDGLRSPGSSKRVLVNDPVATVSGKRWCILLDDTPPGASLLLEVQPIPENAFLGYK